MYTPLFYTFRTYLRKAKGDSVDYALTLRTEMVEDTISIYNDKNGDLILRGSYDSFVKQGRYLYKKTVERFHFGDTIGRALQKRREYFDTMGEDKEGLLSTLLEQVADDESKKN
jgi:hypothetical protein